MADLGPASREEKLGLGTDLHIASALQTHFHFISWDVKKKKAMTRQPWIHEILPKSK